MLATIFIPGLAAARRRGDHPGEPDRRRRMRPPARRDPARRRPDGHAPPRGARPDDAERRRGAHRERGDGPDQHRPRRQDLPRSRPGHAPRDAGHPARQGGRVRARGDAPSALQESARCARWGVARTHEDPGLHPAKLAAQGGDASSSRSSRGSASSTRAIPRRREWSRSPIPQSSADIPPATCW